MGRPRESLKSSVQCFGTVQVFPYSDICSKRPMLLAMSTSILIVDDHDIVRFGVRMLLSKDARWDICGEAADGEQAVEAVRRLHPDIVILDLTMPVMNGFEAAEEIRRIAPYTKIVFFSLHQTPSTARLVGANAFVHKGSAVEDLPRTLKLIA